MDLKSVFISLISFQSTYLRILLCIESRLICNFPEVLKKIILAFCGTFTYSIYRYNVRVHLWKTPRYEITYREIYEYVLRTLYMYIVFMYLLYSTSTVYEYNVQWIVSIDDWRIHTKCFLNCKIKEWKQKASPKDKI